jgi:hypothetical protein
MNKSLKTINKSKSPINILIMKKRKKPNKPNPKKKLMMTKMMNSKEKDMKETVFGTDSISNKKKYLN